MFMPSLKRVGGHDIAFSFIFELCSSTPNLNSERLVISTAKIRTSPNNAMKNVLVCFYTFKSVSFLLKCAFRITYGCRVSIIIYTFSIFSDQVFIQNLMISCESISTLFKKCVILKSKTGRMAGEFRNYLQCFTFDLQFYKKINFVENWFCVKMSIFLHFFVVSSIFMKTTGNVLLFFSIMHQGYSLCHRKPPLKIEIVKDIVYNTNLLLTVMTVQDFNDNFQKKFLSLFNTHQSSRNGINPYRANCQHILHAYNMLVIVSYKIKSIKWPVTLRGVVKMDILLDFSLACVGLCNFTSNNLLKNQFLKRCKLH
ncbi:hypothetical protein AGLY_011803, partial [Aphis glycines]